MNRFARLAPAFVIALAGCSCLAAPAGATEFCVQPADGCAGGQKPTLQAALNAALASAGPDTVRLPAGTVPGPGSYASANPDNTVSVVGAGRDATVVTSATSTVTDYSLDLGNNATVSDLTLKQFSPAVPNQKQLSLIGTADRVGLASSVPVGVSVISGTARHLSSVGPDAFLIDGTLEDSEFTGGGLRTGYGDTIIRRVRVVSASTTGGQNRSLVISSSLFVLTAGAGPILHTEPAPVADAHGTTVLSNVTLIGSGDPGCIGFEASASNGFYTAPDDDAVEDATVANTVVRNCRTTLNRTYFAGNRVTNVTVFNSDIDLSPLAVTQTGAGTLTAGPADGNVNVDPLFVGLNGFDQELRFSSPVIDKGLTNLVSPQESATDLNGNPRVVDGNGDGVAKRDIGAFEYQRRAPVVTANASAPTAAVGQAVTFTGSATESDPGESVTGLAWRFDDGDAATGSDAPHAFSTPGKHTATLTATDSAGVTGSATVTVNVPAPAAGAAVTGLSVSPATFRAAATGASTAAKKKARRPPVGTTVKLRLSAPAAVTIRVQRRTAGRRSGKGCAVPTERNRRAKPCTRTVTLRAGIARASGASAQFRFTGRLAGRALAPGRYALVARVGSAPGKTAAFKIVR